MKNLHAKIDTLPGAGIGLFIGAYEALGKSYRNNRVLDVFTALNQVILPINLSLDVVTESIEPVAVYSLRTDAEWPELDVEEETPAERVKRVHDKYLSIDSIARWLDDDAPDLWNAIEVTALAVSLGPDDADSEGPLHLSLGDSESFFYPTVLLREHLWVYGPIVDLPSIPPISFRFKCTSDNESEYIFAQLLLPWDLWKNEQTYSNKKIKQAVYFLRSQGWHIRSSASWIR
jgi:hypothetical protein